MLEIKNSFTNSSEKPTQIKECLPILSFDFLKQLKFGNFKTARHWEIVWGKESLQSLILYSNFILFRLCLVSRGFQIAKKIQITLELWISGERTAAPEARGDRSTQRCIRLTAFETRNTLKIRE